MASEAMSEAELLPLALRQNLQITALTEVALAKLVSIAITFIITLQTLHTQCTATFTLGKAAF